MMVMSKVMVDDDYRLMKFSNTTGRKVSDAIGVVTGSY